MFTYKIVREVMRHVPSLTDERGRNECIRHVFLTVRGGEGLLPHVAAIREALSDQHECEVWVERIADTERF